MISSTPVLPSSSSYPPKKTQMVSQSYVRYPFRGVCKIGGGGGGSLELLDFLFCGREREESVIKQ